MSNRCLEWCAANIPLPASMYVGGDVGSQCLDIAHCVHLCIEKGMDAFSRTAVATSDIRRFYDSICPIRVANDMRRMGCPPSLCATVVRIQLCPSVTFHALGCTSPLLPRCSSTLTGSRTAGALGRIIVCESVKSISSQVWDMGFNVCEGRFCLASWIDNVFTFSSSLSQAVTMQETFEAHISRKWGLQIKPSSRRILVCKGSGASSPDHEKWPIVCNMNVLGHVVQNDSGIRSDWRKTKLGLWKCFWGSCGSRAGRSLGAILKVKLLQRSVLAFFQWKLSRWPFQKTIAIELDALQCQMLAIIMNVHRSRYESVDQYCRRRRREARKLAAQCCFWSAIWAKRVINC